MNFITAITCLGFALFLTIVFIAVSSIFYD